MARIRVLIILAFLLPSFHASAGVSPPLAGHGKETGAQKEARASNPGNLVGHGGPVRTIAVSPSGKYALTGSFDYGMIYWDISGETPKIVHRFDDHDAPVSAVAFLPGESEALAACDDGTITRWDLKTNKQVHRFTGHQSKIVSLKVSSDGKRAASASWDRSARLWDLTKNEPGPVLSPHQGPVNVVAFAPFEGHEVLYTASYDGKLRRWNIETGALERQLYSHGWGLNVIAPIDNGAAIAYGSLRGETGIVDTETGEQIKTLPAHDGPVLALAKSADEQTLVFGGGDGVIRVWSLKDGGLVEQYDHPYGPVWAIALTHDAKALYFAGLDDFATLWQINPRKPFEPVSGNFPRRFQKTGMPLGERQFARKCSVCHTLTPEGGNRAGPTLYGLIGRKAGTVKGYAYSKALKESGIVWDERTITNLFEQGPDVYTPGSKMPLQRITDREKRDALIAFLKEAGKETGAPSQEEGIEENNK